jgi:periplasmic copper chaperone A
MKFKLLLTIGIIMLVAVACSPPASDLVVSNAWARPALGPMDDGEMDTDSMSAEATAEAGMSDMDSDTMGDMEATAEPGDMAMGEMSGGGANMTGAFMLIENKGGAADKLISADTAVAGVVEIHETKIENDVASMSPVEGIEIPANGSVQLKPGSFHIMLMQLNQDLVAGETLSLTLKFESGKELKVKAIIQEIAP